MNNHILAELRRVVESLGDRHRQLADRLCDAKDIVNDLIESIESAGAPSFSLSALRDTLPPGAKATLTLELKND